MRRVRFRRRWLGHKYGPARGVAVFSNANKRNPEGYEDLALSCDNLRKWCYDRGLILDDTPQSLSELDERLNSWNSDESRHGIVDLSNEVGIYLGTVVIANVLGSCWRVWPNGHPVIRLNSGKVLDVTRMVDDRLRNSGTGLPALYAQARAQ